MFTRVFNRRRRLGLYGRQEPEPAPAPPIPPDAEPIPDGDTELDEVKKIVSFAPVHGWAHTETRLYKIVQGLRAMN